MKSLGLVAVMIGFAHLATAQEKIVLKDEKDRSSYGIGMNFATNLKRQGVPINLDAFLAGFKDTYAGAKTQLTEEEMAAAIQALQRQMINTTAERNRAEGEAFLVENKKKEGVIQLPSGLQYTVIKDGKGPIPKATDKIRAHYRGTLINGKEFDSSYQREPMEIGVGQVIKGWTEALQLMKVGSKWKLFVPADLAYASGGVPQAGIGPYSTLIFEMELLEIVK